MLRLLIPEFSYTVALQPRRVMGSFIPIAIPFPATLKATWIMRTLTTWA